MSKITKADFARWYEMFSAPVSRFDCGRKCAPLNGGDPVCCSTQNAVPVVDRPEWDLLRSRTDLWHRFKPYDYATRQIVGELSSGCLAIECKGARHCERENRSLGCRSFPFFPYMTREKEMVGLGVYWVFQDRCWLISNLQVVDRAFIDEFFAVYQAIFAKDKEEFDTYVTFSASCRRVHSRWKRSFPILGRDGRIIMVEPGTGRMRPRKAAEPPRFAPFTSEAAYARAVREAGGTPSSRGLKPE